jgi:hypothetical protein
MRSLFVGTKDTFDNKSMRELQRVEDEHQSIMKKHAMSFFRVSTCMKSTVLQSILMDPLFFSVVAVYIVVRIAVRAETTHSISSINSVLSEMELGVMAFALTYFLLLTYKRSTSVSGQCM